MVETRKLCLLILVVMMIGACSAEREELNKVKNFTGEVVIHLAESIDPERFAELHGLQLKKEMEAIPRHYVFKKSLEEHEKDFSKEEHVLWHAHQEKRGRQKRSTTTTLPPTDPSFTNQWHLKSSSFVNINVMSAWESGFFGSGVTVGIVDDGIDWENCIDTKTSYSNSNSHDFNFDDEDPTPFAWDVHGTEAATVATGDINNNYCGVGVAPLAKVAGLRLLAEDVTDAQEADSLSYRNQQISIYSNSWGPYDDGKRMEGPGPLAAQAMENSIREGRGGKGSIYVWACGNGRPAGDSCNYDGYASSKYTISVAAVDHYGKQAYYSENCPSILISAPSSDNVGNAITTASTKTCISNFGGTSAACPMIVGVVALMLGANPNLTWRDVQAILIETAEVNDASDANWQTNNAKYPHNHKYGFGLVNAADAVETSVHWKLLPEQVIFSSGMIHEDKTILKSSTLEVEYNPSGYDSSFVIEHIEVYLSITFSRRGALEIHLLHDKIDNVLQFSHNDASQGIKWTYSTIKHWGEKIDNEAWVISIKNTDNSREGALNDYSITFYGHLKGSS